MNNEPVRFSAFLVMLGCNGILGQRPGAAMRPTALTKLQAPGILGGCPTGSPFTGLVGELVVYSTLLSADDRAALAMHLKAKWRTP